MAGTDPRTLECDAKSMVWCFNLGRQMRAMADYAPSVRSVQFCPFREGTKHRSHWVAGWKSALQEGK